MTTPSGLPTGSERACAASPHELAEGLRKHYEAISAAACEWHNQIPVAIDMWEAVRNGAADPRLAASPPEASRNEWPFEVRLDDYAGEVDEIVGRGYLHMERLDDDLWWFSVTPEGKTDRLAWTICGKTLTVTECDGLGLDPEVALVLIEGPNGAPPEASEEPPIYCWYCCKILDAQYVPTDLGPCCSNNCARKLLEDTVGTRPVPPVEPSMTQEMRAAVGSEWAPNQAASMGVLSPHVQDAESITADAASGRQENMMAAVIRPQGEDEACLTALRSRQEPEPVAWEHEYECGHLNIVRYPRPPLMCPWECKMPWVRSRSLIYAAPVPPREEEDDG